MEHIKQPALRFVLELSIRKNMARHYKNLSSRLNAINVPDIIMENISREFRFLETDIIKDINGLIQEVKEDENDNNKQNYNNG